MNRLIPVALTVGLLGTPLVVLPGVAEAATTTYTSSGTYDVPAGVTMLRIVATGAGGGGGQKGSTSAAGDGGSGAVVTAYQPVTPGDSLTITIGTGGGAGSVGAADRISLSRLDAITSPSELYR